MAVKFTIDKGGSTASSPKKTTNAFGIGNASQGAPFYIAKPKPIKSAPKPSNNTEIWDVLAARKAAATTSASTKSTSATNPTTTTTPAPVQTTPAPPGPVEVTTPEPEPETEAAPPPEWTLEGDPFYKQALADAQAQFNLERIGAQATKQYQEVGINRSLDERPATAEASRRRLAGNYAARGMGGGNSGALSRAEAESNARELTARTGLREQLSELNRQFVGQYGADGSDWLGTLRGQSARDTASNFALQNRLAGATTVG